MDIEESDPTEIFDSLTNSTRIEILQALANAYTDAPNDPWVEYNELRDAVGIRDNGNFNYHLKQLDDFIVKRAVGYRLSRVGMELISTVTSGVFSSEWTWGPIDAPGDCLFCDDSVELYYEEGMLFLTCGNDKHSMGLSVSPSLLDSHPKEDVIERIAFMENQWGALTRRGICSECQGYVSGRIEFGGIQPDHYLYHGHCHHCGFQHGIPLGLFLISHPTVSNFYYEQGIDTRSTPFWTLDFCTPGNETAVSTDPLRLQGEITHGGETLSLTVSGDGSIISSNRS